MNRLINNIEAGANNLLINCAAVKPGDKILLVGEDCESPFFDPELCDDIARAANKLGVESRVMLAQPVKPGRIRWRVIPLRGKQCQKIPQTGHKCPTSRISRLDPKYLREN
jgi:hypothetical protein